MTHAEPAPLEVTDYPTPSADLGVIWTFLTQMAVRTSWDSTLSLEYVNVPIEAAMRLRHGLASEYPGVQVAGPEDEAKT